MHLPITRRTASSQNPKPSCLAFLGAILFILACGLNGFSIENGPPDPRPPRTEAAQTSARSQATSPARPWVEITPTTAVVAVGRPRPLSLWNDSGERITDATWSLSNPELADIVSAESDQGAYPETGEHPPHGTAVLVGKAPGQVTVTAQWKNATAQTAIEIVPGPFLKGGVNRWVVAAHSGYSTIRFLLAYTSQDGPAIYSIENGGEKGLWVRGLDLDGAQTWAYHWAEPVGAASLKGSAAPVVAYLKRGTQAFIRAVPDTQGGVILQFESADSRSLLVKLDARTGKEVWRYASQGWLYRTSTTHYDGTIFIVEMQSSPKPETALIGINGLSGVIKSRLPFPLSQTGEKNAGCKEGNDHVVQYPSPAGAPMTSEHSSVFLEVEVSSRVRDTLPCKGGGTLSINNSLRLLELKKDGTHNWRMIRSFTYDGPPGSPDAKSVPRPIASEVIPDGQGGVQAAWTYSVESPTRKIEARITRISPAETKEFSLPFPGWGGTPWEPSDSGMVLGEQTTGMASVGNKVVAYDVVTGEVKWTWRAGQGIVQILMSLAGNGLLIMNRGDVVKLDASGKLEPKSEEVLSKRYRTPMAAEDVNNDQIDEDGVTAFNYDFGRFFAIQTPRLPGRPSALVAVAIDGQLY